MPTNYSLIQGVTVNKILKADYDNYVAAGAITQEQIEKRLKKKIETMNADDFVEYTGIFNAIKNGESKVAEWFDSVPIADDLTDALKGVKNND